MTRLCLSCLLVGGWLALGAARGAEAPEPPAAEAAFKPAVVLCLSGYDELIEDLNFIGEVAMNQPQFGEQMEQMVTLFTQGQGLVGLDEKKPLGVAVGTDGIDFEILAFLPIDDCKPLMEALAALNPEELDDGRWRITLPQFNIEINVRSKGGWTYFATKESTLDKLPADPLTMLAGLDTKYDIAVRASMGNLPENFRELAMAALQGGFAEGLQQGGQDLAEQVDDDQLKQMEEMLKGLDEITLGWTTDRDREKVLIDFTITALPGSEYARQMQLSEEGRTRFAGFLVDDAPLVFNLNQNVPQERLAGIEDPLRQFHEMLPKVLEEQLRGAGSDADRAANQLIHDAMEQFLDVVGETLKQGTIDVSLAVLGQGPHQVVGAAVVAGPEKLTAMLEELKVKGAQLEPPLAVTLDAGSHGDVKFHRIDLPLNDDERQAMTKVFGENPQLTIGVGKGEAYLALGADGIETLKKLIDDSARSGPKSVPSAYLRAELGPLVAMANELQAILPDAGDEDDEDNAAGPIPGLDLGELDLSGLKFDDNADRVIVTMKPVENGLTIHVEAEKGLLVLLGSFARLMASQAPFPVPGVQ